MFFTVLFGGNPDSFAILKLTQRRVMSYPPSKNGKSECSVCSGPSAPGDKVRRHWYFHHLFKVCNCGRVITTYQAETNHNTKACSTDSVRACYFDGSEESLQAFELWLESTALTDSKKVVVTKKVVKVRKALASHWNGKDIYFKIGEEHHARFYTMLRNFGESEVSYLNLYH